MTHQIDQLKEEIQNKEQALVKEHSINQSVEKEKEKLKAELQQMKLDALDTKGYIDAQQSEERKLLKIIQEADAERSRQKKQLEQVFFLFHMGQFVNNLFIFSIKLRSYKKETYSAHSSFAATTSWHCYTRKSKFNNPH